MRILLSALSLVTCTHVPAYAQDSGSATQNFSWIHLAMTVLGIAVAVRLAFLAFERRALKVADVPTFPKYMTCRRDYRLGVCMFMIFASGFFLLLLCAHGEVSALIALANKFGVRLPTGIMAGVEEVSVALGECSTRTEGTGFR